MKSPCFKCEILPLCSVYGGICLKYRLFMWLTKKRGSGDAER